MESLARKIQETQVPSNSLALFWISQAGFVFKSHSGRVICVDPYLTDYVERALPDYGLGFKRIMAKIIEPEEVDADYVVSTHSHQDHLDVDALPGLLANPRIHLIGAPDCRDIYVKAGVPEDRFSIFHQGETIDLGGPHMTGVYADHGDAAPEALGVLLDFDGIKVWQVGDSAYRPDMWHELFEQEIDILLPPINGAFGNLNAVDAAKLTRDSGARIVIPCHYWMFALHYGNPAEFLEACKAFAPQARPLLLTQGERFIYTKQ
ncbi:MAG: MBL fold metallo-hydrolase [Chloroflexi bacterium]|nr:MBL fold metallo-hydrolase [Chloroflexota bacterium]